MALGLDKSSLWSLEWDFFGHSITLASAEHPLQECSSLWFMGLGLCFFSLMELCDLTLEFFGLFLIDVICLAPLHWKLVLIVICREDRLSHTRHRRHRVTHFGKKSPIRDAECEIERGKKEHEQEEERTRTAEELLED